MTTLSVVVVVFAVLGGLGTLCTLLGVVLPAGSSVGNFFRTAGVDIKKLLGFKKTVETVVKTV
jgi:hypothetical protein